MKDSRDPVTTIYRRKLGETPDAALSIAHTREKKAEEASFVDIEVRLLNHQDSPGLKREELEAQYLGHRPNESAGCDKHDTGRCWKAPARPLGKPTPASQASQVMEKDGLDVLANQFIKYKSALASQ